MEALKKKEDDIDNLMIKELYRNRILLAFHEITDFDFPLPNIRKNSL